MVKMDLEYQGDLRVHAKHQPSGTTLVTDAPVDNHGKGESFSPTDLLATALGSCMSTIMGIVAEDHHIELKGTKIHVEKIMSSAPPRRVQRLNVQIQVPTKLAKREQHMLEEAALNCPVAKSINPQIELKVDFDWPT